MFLSVFTGCSRDILTILEDVRHATHGSTSDIIPFLKSLVGNLTIGPSDNLMELAMMDTNVKYLWDLTDHMSQTSLLQAIDRISFHGKTDSLSLDEMFQFIVQEAFKSRNGDRGNVSNDIILFVDHRAEHDVHTSLFHSLHLWQHYDISTLSGDVIVVIIGASGHSALADIATDENHVIYVDGYPQLPTILDNLMALLCD